MLGIKTKTESQRELEKKHQQEEGKYPYPIIDPLINRACDPNDPTVTLTVRGEVMILPGVYLNFDEDDAEAPEGTLAPYQGVEFITLPKKDAIVLVQAIDKAAEKHADAADPLEPHRQLLGDDGALSFERLIDRAGFLNGTTSFYMRHNDVRHELDKHNVLG